MRPKKSKLIIKERTFKLQALTLIVAFQVIDPLCQHLETDLRLQVHSHLQLDDRNPFQTNGGVNDASEFLNVPPFLLGEKYINIKAKVEAYLEKTFYNLTTVALHNWRTYGEMRAMATHSYKVRLSKSCYCFVSLINTCHTVWKNENF